MSPEAELRVETFYVDVGAAVGEPARLAGRWFEAAAGPGAGDGLAFFCLPGGTYTHRYFDLAVPGHAGYSFARHLAARGHAVVAFDHLGTGESTRPASETGLARQAAAAAVAAEAVRARLAPGRRLIGVGHSMGGYVLMLQQAAAASCDALAILGTTNQAVAILEIPDEAIAASAAGADARRALAQQAVARMPELYIPGDRTALLAAFHLGDVPRAVLDADVAQTTTVVPRLAAAESSVPGISLDAAAQIAVPVFLGYGEVDVSPSPHAEPRAFAASDDVTLRVLRGSAHCHNMATTRHALWSRLLAWARTASAAQETRRSRPAQ